MKARKRNYGKRKRNYGSKKLVRSRRNGRAWARGRKEWGKSVGSAGSTCRHCHCVRIRVRLVGENRHSLVTCDQLPPVAWEPAAAGQLCCVGDEVWQPTLLLCNSACGGGDQGTAFNEIPLIVLPQALVSHFIQNSALLVQPALVCNCFHLSFLHRV